jgi:peptidoglycan lytic transglycosylase
MDDERYHRAVRKVWLIVFSSMVLFLITLILQQIRLNYWMKENRYDMLILEASAEYEVDPNLIKAVILRESKFNPKTVGTVGEKGLMQVTDIVGGEWAKGNKIDGFSPEHLFEPRTNIRAGTWYLGKAINNWKTAEDPVPIALAEYNAGRKNVLRWIDDKSLNDGDHFVTRIGFPSTQSYVRTIVQQKKYYAKSGEF